MMFPPRMYSLFSKDATKQQNLSQCLAQRFMINSSNLIRLRFCFGTFWWVWQDVIRTVTASNEYKGPKIRFPLFSWRRSIEILWWAQFSFTVAFYSLSPSTYCSVSFTAGQTKRANCLNFIHYWTPSRGVFPENIKLNENEKKNYSFIDVRLSGHYWSDEVININTLCNSTKVHL